MNKTFKMKKSFIIKIIILLIILVGTVMFINSFVSGFREPVVFMEGDKLIISSSHGVTVSKNEINSVKLISEMPTLSRVGGFGVGEFQKGQVRISNLGDGLAYVKVNSSSSPYIYLELNSVNGNYVFLNLYNGNNTQELYKNIKLWLQN